MTSTIIFPAILTLCQFGDHVWLQGNNTGVSASYSQTSCVFFSFFSSDRPTQDSMVNEKEEKKKMALTLLLPARPVYDVMTCLSNFWISG